jgi:ADP-heptose:LPS heptosyltransferase
LADELAARCREQGLSVICVGHPDYAYCARGCADHRSVDLRESVAAICSARALAGENSGASHLANLCGRPTILWANDQWRIDFSLRWNPFRVPIYIAANDTSQPAPARVLAAITDALRDLRERTNNYTQPARTFPAQRIADC